MENNLRKDGITYCQRLVYFLLLTMVDIVCQKSYNVLKSFREKCADSFTHENECIVGDIEEDIDNKLISNNNQVPDIPVDIYGVML